MRRMAVMAATLLMLGACSGTDDAVPGSTTTQVTTATSTAPTTTSTVTSTTVAPAGTEAPVAAVEVPTDIGMVTVPAPPQRVAALSSVFVEMLFAIGAGDQTIAGDLFSNHPPEAEQLAKVDSFNLNLEAVIALDPDLVVLSFDPGDVVAGLEAVGIPTLVFGTASSLDEAYQQIRALGLATGRVEGAESVVAEMQAGIAAVVDEVGGAAAGLTYYHESDPFTFYTPNSQSFIGQLYTLLGMGNIADAAPDEFGGGFPQLSPEYIIAADPDLVVLASFGEDRETLAAREGWDTLTAVDRGAVIVVDPDIASRWGPRVVDFMRALADGLAEVVT